MTWRSSEPREQGIPPILVGGDMHDVRASLALPSLKTSLTMAPGGGIVTAEGHGLVARGAGRLPQTGECAPYRPHRRLKGQCIERVPVSGLEALVLKLRWPHQ